jgi:UV DNA damage endonuclease
MDRSHMRRTDVPLPSNVAKPSRRQTTRGAKAEKTDPNLNPDILDGVTALRASPDGHESAAPDAVLESAVSNGTANEANSVSGAISKKKASSAPTTNGDAPVANGVAPAANAAKNKRKKAGAQQIKVEEEDTNTGAVNGVAGNVTAPAASTGVSGDPDDVDNLEAEDEDEAEVKEALSRPPPVNSEYLPLPWKGRLGYVCVLQVPFNLN